MVLANTLLAQTLGQAHGCDGSPYMEATQRQSQPTLCWHRHSAELTAVMGHNICRRHRDGPGWHSAGIDARPGP